MVLNYQKFLTTRNILRSLCGSYRPIRVLALNVLVYMASYMIWTNKYFAARRQKVGGFVLWGGCCPTRGSVLRQ